MFDAGKTVRRGERLPSPRPSPSGRGSLDSRVRGNDGWVAEMTGGGYPRSADSIHRSKGGDHLGGGGVAGEYVALDGDAEAGGGRVPGRIRFGG